MGLMTMPYFLNVITETQDDASELTSIKGGTQDDPSLFNSRTVNSTKSSNVTPDKGHRQNLVKRYPLKEYPIHQIERNKPHALKPHYKE